MGVTLETKVTLKVNRLGVYCYVTEISGATFSWQPGMWMDGSDPQQALADVIRTLELDYARGDSKQERLAEEALPWG